MNKKTTLAALICASLSPCVLAQSIEGTVQTQSGKPLKDAKVELEGSGVTVKTGENGNFVFDEVRQGINEIHISAPGFNHLHNDIVVSGSDVVTETFIVARSPIEVIDVIASPIHLSSMESAMPVSVLGGETLRRQQTATLGDSLEKLVGVHSSFHAKVASTPIIRGLSGPRVLITQNGLDVSDVSRVGPDHGVASEVSTAQQIEVLRGPATLFYGSGAIGGVVNVVDNRVPTSSETQGEWLLEYGSVDDQKLTSFNATTGTDSFAFYADGFYRKSNDYNVPVSPEIGSDEHSGEHNSADTADFSVANSGEESNGFTLGTSYLFDKGYVGVSVEQFNREYGIPGHSHGEEEGHDHGHGHQEVHSGEEHSDEEHSDDVFADLEQTRIQLLSEMRFNDSIISGINVRAGFTDYEHSEIEGGSAGTIFENSTYELRLEVLHQPLADFNGGISFHYKNSDFAAQGNEAFTPPSTTEMFALAIMQERHFGDVLLQLGGRIERVTLTADNLLLPILDSDPDMSEGDGAGDGHDGHNHGHDDHDHESATMLTREFYSNQEFTPFSLSIGAVWDFTPGYNFGVSVSQSQRAPSASELLSFGPHIGTRTYEVGAFFALNELGDEALIGLTDEVIDLETATNIDLTLRKTQGNIGFIFNVFYNQIDNYYYQSDTGLFAKGGHGDELPVFIFQTDNVVLHGFEAKVAWQATDELNATLFSDFVRARLKDGGDLPRTPPARFGTQLSYQTDRVSAHFDVTRYQSQEKVASFETTTGGYTLVDLSVSYDLPVMDNKLSIYLKGNNLTDIEARVHTSFLKDLAPRPGRNFSMGITGYF